MNCLVTGGCGFIGSHLVDLLLAEGNRVTVIDSITTGRVENINYHLTNPNLTFIKADINSNILKYFDGVDYVFHLAALADIVPSIQAPDEYFKSNVDGTFNVMECAKKAGIKKLVYSASSSCYGIPGNYPTKETEKTSPQYPYALTKYLGEQIVMHWGMLYKIPVISLSQINWKRKSPQY